MCKLNTLLEKLEQINESISLMNDAKKEITDQLIQLAAQDVELGKSKTKNIGNYKLVVKRPVTYKIDKDILEYLDISKKPFRVKYELNKAEYDKLCLTDQQMANKFDECLTVTPGQVSLKLERVENE